MFVEYPHYIVLMYSKYLEADKYNRQWLEIISKHCRIFRSKKKILSITAVKEWEMDLFAQVVDRKIRVTKGYKYV